MPQSTFILQLPKAWPAKIRSAMLHVVSLAKFSAKKSSLTPQFPLRKTRWTSIADHYTVRASSALHHAISFIAKCFDLWNGTLATAQSSIDLPNCNCATVEKSADHYSNLPTKHDTVKNSIGN